MVTTPQIPGLASRLAGPARLFAARFGKPGAVSPSAAVPADAASATQIAALQGRSHARILPRPAEAEHWDATIAQFATMAEDERWAALLEALHAADQDRTAAPGGRSLADLISKGARRALTQALAAGDWSLAETEIARFAAVQAAHAQDYAAAHLLAQAHIDFGWARRGAAPNPDPDLPRGVWKIYLRHIALAETALEPFDPLEESSALLAATRYLLVRGLEDGEALCRDWYEDWADLDPSNPAPHAIHAPHLLPHWFGTLARFDAEALGAMTRTRAKTGAAAYAVFYLAATDAVGDLPPGLDVPLFLQGLTDFQAVTGCQYRANIVAAALADLDHSLSLDAAGTRRHQAVRAALSRHLRQSLREFHLSTWNRDEALIQYALAQVFADELAQGAHIHSGPNGLIARRPGDVAA